MKAEASSPTAAPPAIALEPADARAKRAARCAGPVVCGLALALGQTLFACALSGRSDPREAYQSLFQWDSNWYAWIAENGYLGAIPIAQPGQTAVGFFPGFPAFTWLVAAVTRLPVQTAV